MANRKGKAVKFKKFDRESLLVKTMFSNQISISGLSSTGTSSTLNGLREKLPKHFRFISGGDMMRLQAKKLNMTIEQFCRHACRNMEYDKKCDRMLADFGHQNSLNVEARLSYLWLPRGFHVKLICTDEVRIMRRWEDLKKDEPSITLKQVEDMILKRDSDDKARYDHLYPGWDWPNTDFDLVLDTTSFGKEEVIQKILSAQKKWLVEQSCANCLSDAVDDRLLD